MTRVEIQLGTEAFIIMIVTLAVMIAMLCATMVDHSQRRKYVSIEIDAEQPPADSRDAPTGAAVAVGTTGDHATSFAAGAADAIG